MDTTNSQASAFSTVMTAQAAPPRAARAAGRGAVVLAATLFVLSGACALAYEVVWTRYLSLFLGNTVLLHTAVLGSFMGGMALGSLLAGRVVERVDRPLRGYGWLEVLIALYAAIFPVLAGAGEAAVGLAAATLGPGSPGLLVFRVALAALLLVVPTVLMGMTFPLLTAYTDRAAGVGASGANWLYFANCTGAVAGTLLTGLGLIPLLGLKATVSGVATLNAVVAMVAILAGRESLPALRRVAERGLEAAAGAARRRATPRERLILAAICLSGASAFIYELVWARFFAVTLGSSTYSFTLMLAAFISGLAAGSVAAQLLPTRRAPLAWLGLSEAAIALVIAVSIPLYPRLPLLFWQWKWLLRPTEESIWLYHLFQYGLTFMVMAIPTFLFGLTFPTAIRAAEGDGESSGHSVAEHAAAVYGWNTMGTLLGVSLAGFALIPLLGLRLTLTVAAGVNLLIAALVLLHPVARTLSEARRAQPVFYAMAGLAVVVLAAGPAWPAATLGYGSFRANTRPPSSWAEYESYIHRREVRFYREDFGTTVGVFLGEASDGSGKQLSLVVDGKTDASSTGDRPTQSLIGHLPLLLKPDARDVFILGLGSGMTVGSVLTHPVERVDCVEISRAVAQAAHTFGDLNGRPFEDPRMRLVIDDGKAFLAASAATGRKYDVIISEPTNPWIAGVGSLFSAENFEATARALKPGGIVAQWFHTYALSDELVATILHTFRTRFPHLTIWQGNDADYIILASQQPISPDFAAIAQRLRLQKVSEDLAKSRISGVMSLLNRQVHTEESAAQLAEGGRLNTDDMPILEFGAPYSLYLGHMAQQISREDRRFAPGSGLFIEQYLGGREPTRAELRELLACEADVRLGNVFLEQRLLRHYLARWPDDIPVLRRAAERYEKDGRLEAAWVLASRAARLGDAQARETAERLARELADSSVATVLGPGSRSVPRSLPPPSPGR